MDLDEAAKRRDETYRLLTAETDTLSRFLYTEPDRLGNLVAPRSDEPTPHVAPAAISGSDSDATATGFGLYMLLGLSRDQRAPTAPVAEFIAKLPISKLQTFLEAHLRESYLVQRPSKRGVLRAQDLLEASISASPVSNSRTLPNSYDTPIHVAGVLVADRHSKSASLRDLSEPLALQVLALGLKSSRNLVEVANKGIAAFDSATRVAADLKAPIPNVPYLWYWNYVAALECVRFVDRLPPKRHAALSEVRDEIVSEIAEFGDFASTFVAYLSASHHAGIDGQFDATDFLFSIAIAALRAPDDHHGGSENLVEHALDLFFERNIASEGSIVPRSPVFIDAHQHAITISTAEHGALLLEALAPYCEPHIDRLSQVARYVESRRLGARGWGSDAGRTLPRRNQGVVCSSISFLLRYANLLDSNAESLALSALGIPLEDPRDSLSIRLSEELENLIDDEIVWPITNGRRDLATMSLVLKGPPGTAKTTAAKRIAALLGWPLLTLDQGAFLREGYENVESEAERVFRLLGHAKDTVVLFDEFEEMILDRTRVEGEKSSRFLTTSMLPRLHRIRDQGGVVFVIATNHLESVDSAAYRFGRIDTVFDMQFPDEKSRQEMYDSVVSKMELGAVPRKLLETTGFPRKWKLAADSAELNTVLERMRLIQLDQFGYGEIRQVVRLLRLRELSGKALGLTDIAAALTRVAAHSAREA